MAKRVRISSSARKAAAKPAAPAVRTGSPMLDTLVNVMTGMGTLSDKSVNTRFGINILPQEQLEAAYRGDWISRKVVDIPADDCTREWRAWQADTDDITALTEAEVALGLQNKVRSALIKARLYGGGALIIGSIQGEADEPLEVERTTQGDLKYVHALSKNNITAGPTNYDLMSPWFGEPEYYTLTTMTIGGAKDKLSVGTRIHPSRVVQFVGCEYPDIQRAPDPWGDSVLQAIHDAIIQTGTVSTSFSQLVQDAKLDVLKIPGLSENLSNTQYESRLHDRLAMVNSAKSLFSTLLLDSEEEATRHSTSFTGMPDLLKAYLLIVSGAANIPATRFLGQSPAGLSSTGESDLRNHYDAVASVQKNDVSPKLNRLDEIFVRSVLGTKPDGLYYIWNSLWQMTEEQKAELSKKKADIFKIDVDSNLVNPEVLREARLAQLIEDGTYPGLEQIVDEYGAEAEEPEIPPALEPFAGVNNKEGSEEDNEDPEGGGQENSDPEDPDKDDEDVNDGSARTQARKNADSFADQMVKRLALVDLEPRSLYVRRNVVNAKEIAKWAKEEAGFDTVMRPEDMHVTICYSKGLVDWPKLSEPNYQREDGSIRIAPGGMRVLTRLGPQAVVLQFTSRDLSWRNGDFLRCGATSDYDDYQPHITISWNDPRPEHELRPLAGFQGEIILGPEIWEEVKGFDASQVKEK